AGRADRPFGQRDAAAYRDDVADDHPRAHLAAAVRRPCAAWVHRRDDPGRDRRYLFVDLRLLVAAHHPRPRQVALPPDGGGDRQEEGGPRPRRAHRAEALMPKFSPDPVAAGPTIRGFSGGGFKIDEEVYPDGALLTPDAAEGWQAPAIDALD